MKTKLWDIHGYPKSIAPESFSWPNCYFFWVLTALRKLKTIRPEKRLTRENKLILEKGKNKSKDCSLTSK